MTALLSCFGLAHAAQLSLTWSDMSGNEDGFHVERKTGTGGTYATIATPAAGTTGYVDGTVTAGTTYCYRVNAYNTAGDSAYSNEACAAAAVPVTYAVTVAKSGAGSGTVASSPNGITCGSDCSESYASQTSVVLSATAATGSTFTGWSGACTGTGTCILYVDAAKNATATFALSTNTLNVTKAGTGSGTVTSTPTGVSCGSDCTEPYASGASVTLTATPASGATFTGWSGACSGTGACAVSMTAARSVTATFALAPTTLTVTKAGTGTGTVTSTPTGVTCGTDCTETYAYNNSVTLTATPTSGSTFTGWSGACTGTGACTVSMTAARSVTATFGTSAATTYALMVTRDGTGVGLVASDPAGINCGTTCGASFGNGSSVTLQAMPEAGSTFTGWSGACSGTAACRVTMNQAQGVTATFALQGFSLSLSKSGAGTVTSIPIGINCGSTCSATYSYQTSVTLTAAPPADSTFTGWSGACTGTGATCTVTMDAAKTATAVFAATTTATTSTQTTYTLTVRKDGNAKGTVTASPGGIACGRDCSERYAAGTLVTLTASPATGATFAGWSGACAGTGQCAVTLNQSTSVTASFTKRHR